MRHSFLRALVVLSFVVGVVCASRAEVQTYTVAPGRGQEVVFASKAPMESFEGRTDQASGTIAADPANLLAGCEVRIAVALASLKTGIGMRDTHMRERHLETDEFPQAVFTGSRVITATPASLAPGGTARVSVAGAFDLHGVSREMELPVELAMATDGTLTVRAEFNVLLSDHKIDRPKVLMLKLADEQKVRVALTARVTTEPAR